MLQLPFAPMRFASFQIDKNGKQIKQARTRKEIPTVITSESKETSSYVHRKSPRCSPCASGAISFCHFNGPTAHIAGSIGCLLALPQRSQVIIPPFSSTIAPSHETWVPMPIHRRRVTGHPGRCNLSSMWYIRSFHWIGGRPRHTARPTNTPFF